MFFGTYDVQIDAGGRLTIPVRLREDLGDEVVVTCAFPPQQHLLLFDAAAFKEHVRELFPLPVLDLGQQTLKRMLMGSAFSIRVDKAGRVLIPQNLRDGADIGPAARVVGMDSYIEIWAPKAHDRWQMVSTAPEMMERNLGAVRELVRIHEERQRGSA